MILLLWKFEVKIYSEFALICTSRQCNFWKFHRQGLSRLHFCITKHCKFTIDFDFKVEKSWKLITSSSNKCDHWIWDDQIYLSTRFHKDQKGDRFFSAAVYALLLAFCDHYSTTSYERHCESDFNLAVMWKWSWRMFAIMKFCMPKNLLFWKAQLDDIEWYALVFLKHW